MTLIWYDLQWGWSFCVFTPFSIWPMHLSCCISWQHHHTGDDLDDIHRLKCHLHSQFQTKDMGLLKYFLGIEVAQSSSSIVISQRKYTLDILTESDMLGSHPSDTLMDPNVKLFMAQGEPLEDPWRYWWLVGILNYLTVIRPNIMFFWMPIAIVIGILSCAFFDRLPIRQEVHV